MSKRKVSGIMFTLLLIGMLTGTFCVQPVKAEPETAIVMDPSLIEYDYYAADENFTVAVGIEDVEDLYGLDIQIAWNTTWIEYVNHIMKIPVESHSDGVLHSPVLLWKDEVNESGVPGAFSGTTYWLAASSMFPAEGFYGSGIAFEMTLRIKDYPAIPNPDVKFYIDFVVTSLADSCTIIYHMTQNCHIIFHAAPPPYGPKARFTAVPHIANIGEFIRFNASSSSPGFNGTHEVPIAEYRWDFGDGNKTCTSTPIIYHSFSDPAIYYVTLEVYVFGAIPDKDSTTHFVAISPAIPPIGGYSFPIKGYTTTKPLTIYLAIVAILTVSFTIAKRRKKQQN